METCLILTSTTEHFKDKLKEKKKKVILIDKNKDGQRLFPDGETYVRIGKIGSLKGKRVIVLHSGSPKPNEGLMELELVLQVLKDHKIKPEVFFTYFPYGQQDKVFLKGEPNTAESLIRKLLNYYFVRRIYIIDPHFGKMPWVRKYPLTCVSSVPFLTERVEKEFKTDVMLVSPDKGGKRRTGISGFNKKRINSFEVKLSPSRKSFKGKIVGVIDDILETGGTLSRFYDEAIKSGAEKTIALISHGPFEPGIKRIKKKFPKLYITNTVNNKAANIDVTDLILNTIYGV